MVDHILALTLCEPRKHAQVVRCWAVSSAGTVVELQPSLEGVPPAPTTFTPAANDRTHTTRATAVADRRMRPMQEVRELRAGLGRAPDLRCNSAGPHGLTR